MSWYLIMKIKIQKINEVHMKHKAVYKIQNITLAYNNGIC